MKNKILQFVMKKGPIMAFFALLLILPETVFASSHTDVTGAAQDAVEQTMLAAFGLLLKVLTMALTPVLMIIGDLMDNDLIIGPGMEERLLSIWAQVRNLVNIIFVVYLLIMAFYNVSGLGKEGNLAIKTGLPKLIIGLILVNFTFLGGKLVLDVSGILTTAVFSLPEVVEDAEGTNNFKKSIDSFMTNVCYRPDGETTYKSTDKDIPSMTTFFCAVDGNGDYTGALSDTIASSFFSELNASNLGLIMAVNMGGLQNLNFATTGITSIGQLAVNQIFSFAIFLVFSVSYIVLALILVARVAVLWVALAFSPVVVLFYVIPELKSGAGNAGNVQEQVITHIIAPIKIGLILTVGYMMVGAMADYTGGSGGMLSGVNLVDLPKQLLITGMADMQKLLIAVTTIVIIWRAIFSAVDGTLAADLAGTVRGAVESTGGTILGAVKYAPLGFVTTQKPGGKPEPITLGALYDAPKIISSALQGQASERNRSLILNSPFAKAIGLTSEATDIKDLDTKNASKTDIKLSLTQTGKGLTSTDAQYITAYKKAFDDFADQYVTDETKRKSLKAEYAKAGTDAEKKAEAFRKLFDAAGMTLDTDELAALKNGPAAATPPEPPATPAPATASSVIPPTAASTATASTSSSSSTSSTSSSTTSTSTPATGTASASTGTAASTPVSTAASAPATTASTTPAATTPASTTTTTTSTTSSSSTGTPTSTTATGAASTGAAPAASSAPATGTGTPPASTAPGTGTTTTPPTIPPPGSSTL